MRSTFEYSEFTLIELAPWRVDKGREKVVHVHDQLSLLGDFEILVARKQHFKVIQMDLKHINSNFRCNSFAYMFDFFILQ